MNSGLKNIFFLISDVWWQFILHHIALTQSNKSVLQKEKVM